MFKFACLLLLLIPTQISKALTLDYEACGFVDKSDGTTFHPAAVYRSGDVFYLITDEVVNGQAQDFYYRDKERSFTGSAIMLLSGSRHSPLLRLSFRESLIVFTVPMDAIETELAQILEGCAVQDSDFIDSKVGIQVVIYSQSKSLDETGPQHRGVVSACNHFSCSDFMGRNAYDLVQPPSAGATCLSWVCQVRPGADPAEVRVVGLLGSHVFFKKGDVLLRRQMVRAIMTDNREDAEIEGLLRYPNDRKSHSSIGLFISKITPRNIAQDRWRPAGTKNDDSFDSEAEFHNRMFFDVRSDELGFPAFVVGYKDDRYLVVQSNDATAIQSGSLLTTQVDAQRHQSPLSESFEISDAGKIAIGTGLVAYKYRSDTANEMKDFKAISLDARTATDLENYCLLGTSIPSSVLSDMGDEAIEESIVYCAGIENDPLNSDIGGMNFDSGVYPAAVYSNEHSNGLFAGILCKEADKVRIYSADEIRTAFDQLKDENAAKDVSGE
jgi:hypothetical protein